MRRRLRPRSQPARSSRQAGSGAGHAAAAWLHAAALVQRSAWCTESSIHACPARLPSGTDSWLGTGIGVGQRAGRSGGADPANRLRSHRRTSRPMPVLIFAPLGHGPLGTPQGPSLWVRPGALPSSHGPSRAKVAHEPGRRRRLVPFYTPRLMPSEAVYLQGRDRYLSLSIYHLSFRGE